MEVETEEEITCEKCGHTAIYLLCVDFDPDDCFNDRD